MEDKIFEFMEKMYADLKNEIKLVKVDLSAEIQKVGNQVIKLENDHGKKLDALFDGYKQLAEGQKEIKTQMTDIASKLDKQEVEITVIKGGKKNIK